MKQTKKLIAAALVMSLGLAGCGGGSEVPVQQVSALYQTGAELATDRFAGIVVSENAVEIKREGEKSVKELFVAQGDQVSEGDRLFSYDSDELSLTQDKQQLEVDRLDATIEDKKKQISSVEKELKSASGDAKTQLNIQLRQLQTELTQSEYDKEAKKKELDYTKKVLEDVEVKSPINGTIRKINESGEGPYITIQQADAYEVKGTLNELSLAAGIVEGVSVKVISRLDPSKTWSGTVSRVDYNSAQTGSEENQAGGFGMSVNGFGGDSSMSSSTSYPFYIKLDSTEGLLLGQHVYIQMADGAPASGGGLVIPENYVMNIRYDEKNATNIGEVWVANAQGKLDSVQVVFGEYDPAIGGYPVVSGLSGSDYIADPTNSNCEEGAKVSYRSQEDFDNGTEQEPGAADQPAVDELPGDPNGMPADGTNPEMGAGDMVPEGPVGQGG